MNLKRQLAEKRQMEKTKTNLKISRLQTGLRIVKDAEPCDLDVIEFRNKVKEIEIAHGAPLTQRLKIVKR